MNKRFYSLPSLALTGVFIALVFSACSVSELFTTTDQAARSEKQQERLTTQEEIDARALFIRGISAMQLEDREAAESWLTKAQETLHQSSGVNFALAKLYSEMGDYASSLYYANRAVELEPGNKWYRLLLVNVYSAIGNDSEVIEQLNALLSYYPADTKLLYLKARIFSEQGQYEKSNETYQKILNLNGPDRTIHYQRLSNFNQLDDNDAILAELKKLLQLDPDDVHTLLMFGQFYLEQDQPNEARKILKKAKEQNPRHPETLLHLAEIHFNRQEWDKAKTLLLDLVGDKLVPAENKLEIVQYVISRFSNDPENEPLRYTTAALINTLLSAEPDNGLAHAMAAEFYTRTGEPEQSLYHLKITTELMPENDAAWRYLVQSYYVNGYYEEAIKTGKRAEEHVPDDAFVLFFMGGSSFLIDEYKQATEWLKEASELPARPGFRSIILGTLGDAYSTLDRWREAEEAYEAAINLDPDNDVALNNYAYYLSEREEQLEQAKEMASRALELNPDNSAFLDTMGWIHFKMGDYEMAYRYIKAAIETGDASAEVMEHMGDVYDKLEEPDRALYWWQKALEKDESRFYLKERLHIN